jgi:Lon protease-like protein
MGFSESELPLFPLNVVLFPQMVLPIHVFEERYKEMVSACMEGDSRFGVVLIKEGDESGEPAVPCDVGTVARIRRVSRLDDGRLNILVLGESQFRIMEMTQWRPHERAIVSFPDEVAGDPPPSPEEVEGMRISLQSYMRTLLGLRGGWVREVPSPTDPVALSFYVGSVLRGEAEERQRILEATTAAERLAMLVPVLQREELRIRSRLERLLLLDGLRLN